MNLKERLMFIWYGYTSNDDCDWYDIANDEPCDRKDGHMGQHFSDNLPFGNVEEVWTVLN